MDRTWGQCQHPKEFIHAAHVGKEEVVYMVVTAIVVVCTDLLVGVATGVATGVIVAMIVNIARGGIKNFGKSQTEIGGRGDTVTLKLTGPQIFSNFMGTRGVCWTGCHRARLGGFNRSSQHPV